MAEAAVSTVVQRLGDLLIQEAAFLDGVSEEVFGMQLELKLMQAFLKDADKRQDEEERVRNWVSEIREAAYDAEDIIEEFALKVALRRRSGVVNVIKRYATIAKETVELYSVGTEIQAIKTRISNLTKSLQTYGIIPRSATGEDLNYSSSSSSGRQLQLLRRSYSHIVEEDIVGLEKDVKILVEQLVKSDKIVSIYGMGGLGKTTLAKKIYHNSEVRHHFDAFAWAYISQQCQPRDVWEGILFKLINPSKEQREEIAKMMDDEVVKKLYQVQQDKKCLVILDDIWTIETWNKLCPAFSYGRSASSKILLTTRNKDMALHPDPTCFLHEPRKLNDEESWELFKKKAFLAKNYPDSRIRVEMEKLGREMVRKCTGLPLAIIVLGGLLATKKTIYEWNTVRRNIISHLRRGKGHEQLLGVSEVLALSYHELPYQLKPCFLHLGHFPEDYEIPTKKLIRMWVAEGFISSVQNEGMEEETMEDVAQRYLGELVERCMVQVADRGATGRIRTCRMHDLMRDLCLSKAKQENFLEIFHQLNVNDQPIVSFALSKASEARSIGRLRRLAVILDGDLKRFIPSGYKRNSHLRSLLYFHEKACHAEKWESIKSVFDNFTLLRVLDLEGIHGHDGKLPKEIGKLIHLRFLSLRDTDIDELPSTVGNLRYLQTLDILSWNSTVQIPNVILKMQRLRHLYLPESCGYDSEKWQLANLGNLQTLVNFPAEKCDIKDLIRLTHLKKLVIDDPIFGTIFNSPGVTFDYMQSLSFVSNEDSTVIQVIGGCPHLYKLHIEGKIDNLPKCHQFSSNLTKLSLLGSKLTEDPMATLEKLPNLRILRLQMDSYVGKEMVCSDRGFPQLKSLFLYDLPKLEEWKVDEGAMCNFCHLKISNCTSMKMVPDGLKFITTLVEMEIRSMLKAFRTRLENGGEDYYKVQHVPSIVFRYCDY